MNNEGRPSTRALLRELNPFALIYFCLSFFELRTKLRMTSNWYNGALERNHGLLLEFQYANNEQSRILQFYIPEFLVRTLHITVLQAYMVQRWIFIGLAFVLFHLYLRAWFSKSMTFAAVCLLAATLPFSFANDLQESSALLMVTFVASLWAIRDGPSWSFATVLLFGAMNNESSLALLALYFVDRLRGWNVTALWKTAWQTAAVALPAFAYTGWIRYVTRDRPHLGGAWHWPDNIAGIMNSLTLDPLDATSLFMFFIFNVLWILAFLRLSEKPRFVRLTLVMVPAYVIPHLITGIISEVRQMVPLAYVVIPAAFYSLFRAELVDGVRVAPARADGRSHTLDP